MAFINNKNVTLPVEVVPIETGTASGEYISINDMTPFPHELSVKVKNEIEAHSGEDFANKLVELGYASAPSGAIICMIGAQTGEGVIYDDFEENTQYKFVFKAMCASNPPENTHLLVEYTDGTTSETIMCDTSNGSTAEGFYCEFTTEQGKSVACLRADGLLSTGVYFYYDYCGIYKVIDASAVTVSQVGKNKLPYPYDEKTKLVSGINYTVNEDGILTAEGTATANANFNFILLSNPKPFKAGTCVFSLGKKTIGNIQFRIGKAVAKADGTGYNASAIGSIQQGGISLKFTLEEETLLYVNCIVGKNQTIEKETFYPQIEFGETETAFEPYTKNDYTPNDNGTVEGVQSIYPNMTLETDTAGAVIDCEYYKKACLKSAASAVRLTAQ